MSKPTAADNKPLVVKLEPGTYWWCACGLSKDQPYCDGSHQAAGEFAPVEFEVTEAKPMALCMCKRTKNPPRCDGSHTKPED